VDYPIKLLNGLVVKKVLSSKESGYVFSCFLHDFFNAQIDSNEVVFDSCYDFSSYKESVGELNAANYLSQENSVDIIARIKSSGIGTRIQLNKFSSFVSKALYHMDSEYVGSVNFLSVGDESVDLLELLKPVWFLNVSIQSLFDDEYAFRVFDLVDVKHGAIIPKFWKRVAFLELGKEEGLTFPQKCWVELFLTGNVLEGAPDYVLDVKSQMTRDLLSDEEFELFLKEEKLWKAYYDPICSAEQRGKEKMKNEVLKLIRDGLSFSDLKKMLSESGLSDSRVS
jgi:hypothetical protein